MYGMLLWDGTYILVLIGMALCLMASAGVKSTFSRYAKVRSASGLTGAQAARMILGKEDITDVRVDRIAGNLTDNYDPRSKVLHLSESTIDSTSIAAIGVAAHECGHACQHAEHYGPLVLRSTLVPVTQFGQTIAWPLIILGFIMNGQMADIILEIGIIAFALGVIFALITLPVEFNASHRAVAVLGSSGMMSEEELGGVKKVLRAAAMTYVASAASSILMLLRVLLLAGGRRRD